MILQEDRADGDKWDYVIVFIKDNHPADRNGNLHSEDSSSVKKWRKLKKERKDLSIQLQNPTLGLAIKKFLKFFSITKHY